MFWQLIRPANQHAACFRKEKFSCAGARLFIFDQAWWPIGRIPRAKSVEREPTTSLFVLSHVPSQTERRCVFFPVKSCVQLKCQRLPALDFPHTGETGGTRRPERTADFSHPEPFDNLQCPDCPPASPWQAPIRLSISAPFPRRTHVGAGKS